MSVALLPKLDINGRNADEESTRLHFKKNQPDQPEVEFPPFRQLPYPTCVYREHSETGELESRLVGRMDFLEGEVHAALRAQNEREHRDALAAGWVDKPDQVRSAKDRANKAIALAAAERAYDDRRLGDKAKRELEALEDAADDHVVDVPAPKKRGYRKKILAGVQS